MGPVRVECPGAGSRKGAMSGETVPVGAGSAEALGLLGSQSG